MRHFSHRVPVRLAAGALPALLAVAGAGSGAALAAEPVAAPIPAAPVPAHAVVSTVVDYQPPGIRNTARGSRPIPDHTYLAPVRGLRFPVAVAPVAPIAPPRGTLRLGNITVAKPGFLNDDQADQINGVAAGAEARIATFGDAVGLDPSRSDLVASDVVTDAAVGAAAVAGTVGLPAAAGGALIGAVNGLLIALPLFPVGLVLGPAAGAAVGATLSETPFALVGGALGAAAGTVQGLTAPTRLGPSPHR